MVKKRLKVMISPTGEVTIEAIGYTGANCEEATRDIEKALGKVTEKKNKAERFAQGPKEEVKQGGGW